MGKTIYNKQADYKMHGPAEKFNTKWPRGFNIALGYIEGNQRTPNRKISYDNIGIMR